LLHRAVPLFFSLYFSSSPPSFFFCRGHASPPRIRTFPPFFFGFVPPFWSQSSPFRQTGFWKTLSPLTPCQFPSWHAPLGARFFKLASSFPPPLRRFLPFPFVQIHPPLKDSPSKVSIAFLFYARYPPPCCDHAVPFFFPQLLRTSPKDCVNPSDFPPKAPPRTGTFPPHTGR